MSGSMDVTFNQVKEASASDPEIQLLVKTIINGFPETQEELPAVIQDYWKLQDNLSCIDGVALYHNRVVVPKGLRCEVLVSLHSAHQGTGGYDS